MDFTFYLAVPTAAPDRSCTDEWLNAYDHLGQETCILPTQSTFLFDSCRNQIPEEFSRRHLNRHMELSARSIGAIRGGC